MTEKLELCKWIYKNSTIPMKVLSKKSVPYLRALREQIETEQRRDKFNKMMGYRAAKGESDD